MLYHLSELFPFSPWWVFQYITFRSAGAAVTALLLSMVMGPGVIRWLQSLKFRQDYRPKDVQGTADATAAAADLAKRGTPTMGGILIVLVLDITVLLWARWNPFVLLTLLIGFNDRTFLTSLVLGTVERLVTVAFKFVPLRLGVDQLGSGSVADMLGIGSATGITIATVRTARNLFWAAVGLVLLARTGATTNKEPAESGRP